MNYLKHIQEDFFTLVKVPEDKRTVLACALERGILRVLQYAGLLLDHHQPDRFDQELQRYQTDSVQFNQSIVFSKLPLIDFQLEIKVHPLSFYGFYAEILNIKLK